MELQFFLKKKRNFTGTDVDLVRVCYSQFKVTECLKVEFQPSAAGVWESPEKQRGGYMMKLRWFLLGLSFSLLYFLLVHFLQFNQPFSECCSAHLLGFS